MNRQPGSTAWKTSRYVTKIEIGPADVLLLFAAFSGRLIEVPGKYRKAAHDLLDDPAAVKTAMHRELHDLFQKQGVVIPEAFDELEYLRQQYESVKLIPSSSLGLTICPTLNCNFRCSYCYQRHTAGVMGPEVQDRIARYVRSHRPALKHFSITWFGGEPLLELPVIERLTAQFLDLEMDYQASVITNGSLLTNDVSRTLLNNRILRAQITLDGPRKVHDARRRTADGAGTFDSIVRNIDSADPGLTIGIRVNLDTRNMDSMPELFDQLDAAGLRGRVAVYFAAVAPYTAVCSGVAAYCMSNRSWAGLQPLLLLTAMERGYAGPCLPRARRNVCLADRASDLVIVPSGLIFKCWNDVTDPTEAVFDLSSMQRAAGMEENLSRWLDWGPFNFPDCEMCPVLPLCMGGCPHIGIRQGRGACKELKYNLKETILLHYLDRKRRQSIGKLEDILSGINAFKENF